MVSKLNPILTSKDLDGINTHITSKNKTSQKIAMIFDFDVELIELYKEYLEIQNKIAAQKLDEPLTDE